MLIFIFELIFLIFFDFRFFFKILAIFDYNFLFSSLFKFFEGESSYFFDSLDAFEDDVFDILPDEDEIEDEEDEETAGPLYPIEAFEELRSNNLAANISFFDFFSFNFSGRKDFLAMDDDLDFDTCSEKVSFGLSYKDLLLFFFKHKQFYIDNFFVSEGYKDLNWYKKSPFFSKFFSAYSDYLSKIVFFYSSGDESLIKHHLYTEDDYYDFEIDPIIIDFEKIYFERLFDFVDVIDLGIAPTPYFYLDKPPKGVVFNRKKRIHWKDYRKKVFEAANIKNEENLQYYRALELWHKYGLNAFSCLSFDNKFYVLEFFRIISSTDFFFSFSSLNHFDCYDFFEGISQDYILEELFDDFFDDFYETWVFLNIVFCMVFVSFFSLYVFL